MSENEASYEIAYRTELVRKAIHLFSLSIPIIYVFVTREMALAMLIPLTVFALIIDIGRHYITPLQERFSVLFGWLLRRHESDSERKRLNGATYVLISATLCVWIFPKNITITSFCVLIVGDMMAALIGRRYGRHKFFKKSMEGSLAFFVSGLAVIAATPKIYYSTSEYLLGAMAVAVGAVVEALPWEVDDNLSIPLSVGAALWLGYAYWLGL